MEKKITDGRTIRFVCVPRGGEFEVHQPVELISRPLSHSRPKSVCLEAKSHDGIGMLHAYTHTHTAGAHVSVAWRQGDVFTTPHGALATQSRWATKGYLASPACLGPIHAHTHTDTDTDSLTHTYGH